MKYIVKYVLVPLFVLGLVGGAALQNTAIDAAAPSGGHAISGTFRFIKTVFTTAQQDGLGGTDKKGN